jgi:EF-hand domain
MKPLSLFPKESLDEAKADIVIRDLRQTLFLKKISFFEFFKILDSNNDGFITIEEFCSGLDKVIKFSQMIKEGFFSFMDKQKIGMIDYKAFLQTMNKSIFTKQAVIILSFEFLIKKYLEKNMFFS